MALTLPVLHKFPVQRFKSRSWGERSSEADGVPESRLHSSPPRSSSIAVLPLRSRNAAGPDRQENGLLVYSPGIFRSTKAIGFFCFNQNSDSTGHWLSEGREKAVRKPCQRKQQQSSPQIPGFGQTSCSWSSVTAGTSLNLPQVLARLSDLLKNQQQQQKNQQQTPSKPPKPKNCQAKQCVALSGMRKPDLSAKTRGGWRQSGGAGDQNFHSHSMNALQSFGKGQPPHS